MTVEAPAALPAADRATVLAAWQLTEADVEFLRTGCQSASVRKRVVREAKVEAWSIGFSGLIYELGFGALTFRLVQPVGLASVWALMPIFMMVLGLVSGGQRLMRATKNVRALADGRVIAFEGPAVMQPARVKGVLWALVIGDARVDLNTAQTAAIVKGRRYRAFVHPGTQTFLGLEPLDGQRS